MKTPLDALVSALHDAASYNAAAEAPPEAVVWCDVNREFEPLLPALRERLPELLTYGNFDAATRTGPAVWLRAAVAGAVPAVAIPEESTPILYLPGVARETLKGADDCPTLLQPLVWFTVAGTAFGHVNGKDWTLRGFLTSERGALKLGIADDSASRTALSHAALRFCTRPIEELRSQRWNAHQLNALLAPDLAADMLDWIDGAITELGDPARFAAFANIAEKQLKFDPRKLSPQDATRRLAKREGRWAEVWARFAASTGFEKVVTYLSLEEPGTLFEHQDSYPRLNARDEKDLRQQLLELNDLSPEVAKVRIGELEAKHAWRRETVWARRGEAPLAQALVFIAKIAAAETLPSHDGKALAEAYVAAGADVDWAAMRALAVAPRELDREAVAAALRAVYLPWMDQGALALQELIRVGKVKLAAPPETGHDATTILFVDGLRMDLARELVRRLEDEGVKVSLGWMWSGFPTVTATCKPMVSPVASLLSGPPTTADVLPLSPEGKPATKPVLFKLMEAQGWETDSALLPDAKLWAETGRFDEEGHALGARLAERLSAGIRDAADRILQLVRSGRSLHIVTDHGWLLMPGGLPHAALDVGLVEPNGKRTRCAMVKAQAETSYLQVPWSWNPQVSVATATGARSFYASYEYAHGGVSPQECILPVLKVANDGARRAVTIGQTRWEGLRLRVEVTGGADLRVDLRLGSETSGPTLVKGDRVLDEHGRTSFLVSDEHEREAACLVVLDDDGRVLAHRTLTVGED
ncbi:BREX-1 system phosphatase PglZ type B [Thalassobaculum sp. OXR-137]|uniref:BREX-1 system phosphatase PglZ type B n=1 Tax=Thalassobaculum sp. OXR-137 TaxID=3100173 RepID=UPI002AC9AE8C|nr:BREX-1 system phosphatase PglZ type B [Thalassobaculum sp. OXR-137]WPZ34041.1 BREX-1 system phosphatase PglZ type B [Thalassobaculum sp. OXR-137]